SPHRAVAVRRFPLPAQIAGASLARPAAVSIATLTRAAYPDFWHRTCFRRSAANRGTTMPHKTHKHATLALAGLCAALFAFSSPAQAQDSPSQSTQSVADAARAARAAKKARTAKVIQDEDIDKTSYNPGNQGLNVGSAPTTDAVSPNPSEVKA